MKKTIKRCALVVCIFVFIFLMLPFITNSVTSGTSANSNSNKKEKGSPQIFTNNPLTDLVSRISNFFGSDKSKPQKLNQENASPQLAISPEEYLAQAKAKYENSNEDDSNDLPNSSTFGLYTQNEEGDWVLIPQTAPEGVVVTGMHEESIKANDYDRYLQQERTARLIPGVNNSLSAQENIPNSTMAKIFNPIKNFFGFGNSDTVKASDNSTPSQLVATAKDPKEAKTPKNVRKAPELKISPKDPIKIDPTDPSAAEKVLYSFLDPASQLDKLADDLTDLKYPNPPTEEQQEIAQKYKQELLSKLHTDLNKKIDDFMKKDVEQYTGFVTDITMMCGTSGLSPCQSDEKKEHDKNVDITSLQQQNGKLFLEKVSINGEKLSFQKMPQLQSIIIVDKAQEEPLLAVEANDPENTDYNEYWKQWESKKCSETNCFWVANQKAQAVANTFLASNFKNSSSVNSTNTNTEIPYTLYTTQELKQVIQQSRASLQQNGVIGSSPSVLWAVSPSLALQVRQDLQQQYMETEIAPIVLYSRNGHAIDGNESIEARSNEITSDLADITQAAIDEMKTLQQSVYGQAIGEIIAQKNQEIESELKKKNSKLNNLSDFK